MMGSEKASEIRQKLRAAFAQELSSPIPALDRRIRELEKKQVSAEPELRSLRRLRKALGQVIETKSPKRVRRARTK